MCSGQLVFGIPYSLDEEDFNVYLQGVDLKMDIAKNSDPALLIYSPLTASPTMLNPNAALPQLTGYGRRGASATSRLYFKLWEEGWQCSRYAPRNGDEDGNDAY